MLGNPYMYVVSNSIRNLAFRLSLINTRFSRRSFAMVHAARPLYWFIPTMLDEDSDLREKLTHAFEHMTQEVIALVQAHCDIGTRSPEPLPEWMTAAQLARYWQLVNATGEPITAGIMKWTKRAENEHPLPHACMGDLLRFRREEVNRWAQEEAAIRRAEKKRKKLHLAS